MIWLILVLICLAHYLICLLYFDCEWAIFATVKPFILTQRHKDFLFFKGLSRSWLAWISKKPPIKLLGNAVVHYDIPGRGQWVVTLPFYFAITTKNGWHIRGFNRYDYIDKYYEAFAFTVKKLS